MAESVEWDRDASDIVDRLMAEMEDIVRFIEGTRPKPAPAPDPFVIVPRPAAASPKAGLEAWG